LGADPTPAVAVGQVLSDLDVPDGTGHLPQTAALGQGLQNRDLCAARLDDTSFPLEEDLILPEPYIADTSRPRRDGANAASSSSNAATGRWCRPLSTWPSSFGRCCGLIADPMPCGAVWSHSGMGFGYRHWRSCAWRPAAMPSSWSTAATAFMRRPSHRPRCRPTLLTGRFTRTEATLRHYSRQR
jgi:hypothetical protein